MSTNRMSRVRRIALNPIATPGAASAAGAPGPPKKKSTGSFVLAAGSVALAMVK
jgi:hypothetical protein